MKNGSMSMTECFTAIILAADRERDANPVARLAGTDCKALARVNGIPMIERVLSALEKSGYVKRIIVCGPDEHIVRGNPVLSDMFESGRAYWAEPADSPSLSSWNIMQTLDMESYILLTTGDHALLESKMVDFFCSNSLRTGADLNVALADAGALAKSCPGSRRTSYRLKDGRYCSCNLFSFITPEARNAAFEWRRMEEQRKHPMLVASRFGWIAVLKYFFGLLTLEEGMRRISSRLGCSVDAVIMPYPEAAVDVDNADDFRLVSRILEEG